jgi:1,2-diacylglycerol 3-alpha-glucosyltransferase
MEKNKRNVFLVCSGAGRINRGYESFAIECFAALKDNSEFTLYFIKGGGKGKLKEIVLPNLHRKSKLAIRLGKLLNQEPYLVEQFTFCISLLPLILLKKPVVIYYSDFILGTYLWHLRRIFKFRYRLLFSNGAPNLPPYKTEDHVQQLLQIYLDEAVRRGESPLKQTLLPYGFNINIAERIVNLEKKKSIRERFNIPCSSTIILSVGAVNKCQKRMDYVIEEFATLPEDHFLVILGQYDAETPEVIALAERKIPGRFHIANVTFEEVKNFYIAADYFILASLQEGFGRVLIEALSHGLHCIVNDNINARQVLKEYGKYIDMTKKGSLVRLFEENNFAYNKEELISEVYNLSSWDKLKDKYLEMISKVANWDLSSKKVLVDQPRKWNSYE